MSQQYRTYQGEEYLTKIQAESYTGHGEGWLKTRQKKGTLKKYTLDDLHRTYFKRSELDKALAPKEEEIPPDAEYLTLPQIARRLQISEGYVYQLKDKGELLAINFGRSGQGAVWRVHKKDYERFVRERDRTREEVRV